MNTPRVAFFSDTFHEINGVANTSRQFTAFARRRKLPFFNAHPGPVDFCRCDGRLTTLEVASGRASFSIEADMTFDPLFWRKLGWIKRELTSFAPDLVHITSPGQCGILGAILSRQLQVPLVAGWHTNIHEYAGKRLARLTRRLPEGLSRRAARAAESISLACALRFYRLARLILAPNQDLVELLERGTGRRVELMRRGVDTILFSPERRTRRDANFVIGYVGRLTPEKNVRFLAALERALMDAGISDFEIVIAGQGSEREWLEANLQRARFCGVLTGEALARQFAAFDVFVFPSHTDTYGNVIHEAMASGVPVIVTTGGGPKFLVHSGIDGFVAVDEDAFLRCVLDLYRDRVLLDSLRTGARQTACRASWDRVFETVYEGYAALLAGPELAATQIPPLSRLAQPR